MIFKSRQVNLDREPYVWPSGVRSMFSEGLGSDGVYQKLTHAPRPEFEPTRDPEPWQWSTQPEWRTADATRIIKTAGRWVWAPRREQFDTPVNLILQDFRSDVRVNGTPVEEAVLDTLQWVKLYAQPGSVEGVGGVFLEITAEMIDHARRVLTRLANWKE